MKAVRGRVLLPVAVGVTLAAPALRALPGGTWLPDPWLLLALVAVPARAGDRMRATIQVVGLLGLLRSAVSASSVFVGWAGLAWALAVRQRLHRHLSEEAFLLRFLVGAAAALPPALLERWEAARLGASASWIELLFRVVCVGVFWAVVGRPGPRRLRLRT